MSIDTANMNEAAFASLSPSLLARKGGARPAMRPQHGGLLGSIGSGLDCAADSDGNLDDLGWNDMGDEYAPHHDADVIKLTPSPINPETAALARQMDEVSGATLAQFANSQSPGSIGQAREQQHILAKRIERTSPPILSDAIMSHDDEPEFAADTGLEEETGFEDDGEPGPDPLAAGHCEEADLAILHHRERKAVHPPLRVRAHRVAAVDQGKRAAFTLRLDAERHLKLRLASTIGGRSAQQIVTDALDAFLRAMPELETLAAQVQQPGTKNC